MPMAFVSTRSGACSEHPRHVRPRTCWLAAIAAFAAAASPARAALADGTDACIASAEHAQRLRLAGQLRAARGELLVCARESCPGPVASDCKRWLGEIDTALPSIVVRAVDGQGNETTEVRVSIDGTPVATHLDGRPIAADPGEHVLVAEGANGSASASVRFVLREGEHDRLVSVDFPSPAPAARVPAASWILGGVGVAALGAGATLWALGMGERADLLDNCGKNGRVCSAGDETPAKTKLLVGDIAFGGGLVSLGAAVWLALRGWPSAAPAVDVHPVAGGAVVGYGAAF
jgi:hypothetical protein